MKVTLAICDDDAAQRTYLEELVTQWGKGSQCLTEVRQYSGAEAFLFEYEEKKDFDILLLDVEMPGQNGIELAKRIRRENDAAQIIFITGYYEYFSDGFDVSALHYLLKPVHEEKLISVLNRAVENIKSRQRSILIATAEADIKLPIADICYVEAENVYVLVHTAKECYRMRCTLAKFSEQLDRTFFKVHRSYLVSLKEIARITRTEILMTNGDRVPISRGMYDSVHEALIQYL